ncbi:MAG: hypothetical protein Q8M95_07595 [Candidatus Methanoperedens sp.]|nr:hypothetical protein [Candidatus Methanoperedens sp.]
MKIEYRSIIATVILLTFITSAALASQDENRACNGCHTYSPQSINITTDINSIIVSPNEPFVVNISWSGGDPSGVTGINWPTNFANIAIIRDNTLFNPNPRILANLSNTPIGTTSSTLTAPPTPGTYTVRVYASRGSNATLGEVTDFKDITVIVQASYNVSMKVDSSEKITLPGVNASYLLTINNTGNALDNFTIEVSNPDGAAVGLSNTKIQNLAAGANATVLLNVTNATARTLPFRVNVTANSTGDKNRTATVNTTTTVRIQPTGGAPKIISYSPKNPIVKNKVGDQRTFNIKLNTTANVTWYIYNVYGLDLFKMEVFSQIGVTESSYANTSAASGIWIVKAIASNQNGTDLYTWVWSVSQKPSRENETKVRIEPKTLNLASKGKFTASISLAEGYDVADINISTVECEGAHALKGEVKKKGNVLQVKFNRQDIVNVSPGKAVRLTVTGMFNDGVTKFEGSDVIRVINNANGKDEDVEEDEDKVEENDVDENENVKKKDSEKVTGNSNKNAKKEDGKKVTGNGNEKGKKKDNNKVKTNSKGKKLKNGLNEDENDSDKDED